MVDNSVNVQLGNKSASPKNFLVIFFNPYFHAMTQLSGHFHTKNEFDTFIIQRVTILFANPYFWTWPNFVENYFFHFLIINLQIFFLVWSRKIFALTMKHGFCKLVGYNDQVISENSSKTVNYWIVCI